ncbi:MAG: hypothetical protein K6G91_02895 [Kiritimatiellae bacterium]|nr:hypothetical protein [Kiritimatiellia bacterium]
MLKDVCDGSGNGAYYEAHISHERFVRLVLSTDTAKLGRMKRILEDAKLTPIDVLRGMGAVLNDEPLEERMALGAKERRIANAELKTLVEETKNAIDNVGAKVDEVDRKVSKLRKRGKKRGKYTDAQLDFCGNIWAKACDVQEIRNSSNTKVSYKTTYKFYHRQLENLNVKDADMFKSIIRAYQARELRRRRRENPAAKKEKKVATKPAENGKNEQKMPKAGNGELKLAETSDTPVQKEQENAQIPVCRFTANGGNGIIDPVNFREGHGTETVEKVGKEDCPEEDSGEGGNGRSPRRNVQGKAACVDQEEPRLQLSGEGRRRVRREGVRGDSGALALCRCEGDAARVRGGVCRQDDEGRIPCGESDLREARPAEGQGILCLQDEATRLRPTA